MRVAPLLDSARLLPFLLLISTVFGIGQAGDDIQPQPRDIVNNSGQVLRKVYSKQNARIQLECGINITFRASSWIKDGQRMQTVLPGLLLGPAQPPSKQQQSPLSLSPPVARGHHNHHQLVVDSFGNLIIENVHLDDAGHWMCELEDVFGFTVNGHLVQLIVMNAPKKAYLMIENRILDPGNPFIPVKENGDLTVSCVVDDGSPVPALDWELALGSLALLDAPEVPADVLNLTETVREQRAGGVRNDVRLARVQRAHNNATLTCYVRHIALDQPLNVSVLINVQYTPSFAISREPGFGFPILEGMAVSLKCDVDANPKALPLWRKDNAATPVQQSVDGYLNFTVIRREHSGWYKCVTHHQFGHFSSIGYFLNVRYESEMATPAETITNQELISSELSSSSGNGRHVEVDLGGAVQLSCPSGMTGCWTRIEPSSGRQEPLGATDVLSLERILYEDGGEYRCVVPIVRNSTRKLEQIRNAVVVQLVVTGKPTVQPAHKTITAVYGQPLTISVQFCANPPYNRLLWLTRWRVYRPGDSDATVTAYEPTNATEPHCHQAVLFLSKVTAAHIGEYTFLVRSEHGLAEGNFHVNMTYASGYRVVPVLPSNSSRDEADDENTVGQSAACIGCRQHLIGALLLLTVLLNGDVPLL